MNVSPIMDTDADTMSALSNPVEKLVNIVRNVGVCCGVFAIAATMSLGAIPH